MGFVVGKHLASWLPVFGLVLIVAFVMFVGFMFVFLVFWLGLNLFLFMDGVLSWVLCFKDFVI